MDHYAYNTDTGQFIGPFPTIDKADEAAAPDVFDLPVGDIEWQGSYVVVDANGACVTDLEDDEWEPGLHLQPEHLPWAIS